MSMRELMLGKSGGKTGWQHLKDRWNSAKQQERYDELLAKLPNPLGLQPGDLVDIGWADKDSYEVELLCAYVTPGEDPDFTRYSLRPLIGDGDGCVLEAMPSGEHGELLFSLLEREDDVPLDDETVAMLEDDVLFYPRRGRETEHHKDFEVEVKITVLAADKSSREFGAFCFNFFEAEDDNSYVAIDALDHPVNTAHVYVGKAVDEGMVDATGTAPGADRWR